MKTRISLAFKALRELGPRQLGLYALYQVGLRSGYFRRKTEDQGPKTEDAGPPSTVPRPIFDLPDPGSIRTIIGPEGLTDLKVEADEIVEGQVRLFGGLPVPLVLTPPGDPTHWTAYALGKSPFPNPQSTDFPINDIKFIWEPARFGWTFILGRAYYLTGDQRYPAAFWRYFEIFRAANPVNMGPNWESAQEVALRILAFAFAAQIFPGSIHSTTARYTQLNQAIVDHANRIPSTLIYARSQNNNHLLSEAAGLISASLALPEHPQSKRWSNLGWKWFNWGLQHQIGEDGCYIQQSTNYHRMMLQLALWVYQVSGVRNQVPGVENRPFSKHATHNLQLATRWLLAFIDPESGRAPNLGPNDGAYILPLTTLPFEDYRPVLQAASRSFLCKPAFEPGAWDEMSLWLQGSSYKSQVANPTLPTPHSPLSTPHSRAYLRAAKFHGRPGHADQLHLDLWWRGLNIAQDAGTYLYNADPPWDNALTHTAIHNTVMVNNQEQMTPAGRFLYLDRAQAKMLQHEQAEDGSWEKLTAQHDGYRRLRVRHQRSVTMHTDDRWVIEDRILPLTTHRSSLTTRLHWLLPDWEFEIQNSNFELRVCSPHGWIQLTVQGQCSAVSMQLVRAGELLHGEGEISPTWGWVSPTYGQKIPALSFSFTQRGELPITFQSIWSFPHV